MDLDARYVDVVDVAKLVRESLGMVHPEVRFSVRSSRYAGGASIHVNWTGGPTRREVEATVKQYEGSRLDGDYSPRPAYHYLFADGQAMVAYIQPSSAIGATDPLGVDNRRSVSELPSGTELVRFGADFVMCGREPTIAEAVEMGRQDAERRANAAPDGLPF